MAKSGTGWWLIAAAVAPAWGAQPLLAQDDALTVALDEPIDVEIDGTALNIALHTGGYNRLTLHPETVARMEIRPDPAVGNEKPLLKIGGTGVLIGRSRRINVTAKGVEHEARLLWFPGASGGTMDGTMGPLAMPHDHIAIRLGGSSIQPYSFPLLGSINGEVGTRFTHDGGVMFVNFAVEETGPYPLASAAAGAAIAAAYDGVSTDEVWREHIALGIRRWVRLVRLGRPLVIGPFSFDAIAVRVRDRLDGTGSGDKLPEPASPDDDPSEIVVTAPGNKGPQPVFSFRIGRADLERCSMLEYEKGAKEIRLSC